MQMLLQATHNSWLLVSLFIATLMCVLATGNTRQLPPLLFQPIKPPPGQKPVQQKKSEPSKPRRKIPFKIIFYSTITAALVIFSGWFCVLRSVRFDWDPEDIAEIQIQQFPLNDTKTKPQKTLSIKDGQELAAILAAMPDVQPTTQPREYANGRNYLLRIKHRSNDQWSRYQLQIVQDRETANQAKAKKIYLAFVNYESSRIKLGDYEATALGELVEQIANKPVPPKPAAKPATPQKK